MNSVKGLRIQLFGLSRFGLSFGKLGIVGRSRGLRPCGAALTSKADVELNDNPFYELSRDRLRLSRAAQICVDFAWAIMNTIRTV